MKAMVLPKLGSLYDNQKPLVAAAIPIKPEIQEFGLEEANEALLSLRTKKNRGAKVLRIAI